jgi:hypothetical protein
MAITKSPITPGPQARHRWSERPYVTSGDDTPQPGVTDDEDTFVPYRVILANGPLSPTEDLDTAIVAARQAQALGQSVERIEQGARIVLEGDELSAAIRESDEHKPADMKTASFLGAGRQGYPRFHSGFRDPQCGRVIPWLQYTQWDGCRLRGAATPRIAQ